MKTRRDFLKIGSLALAGGLILGGSQSIFGQTTKGKNLFPIPSEILADAANSFHSSTFEPFIDSVFTIQTQGFSAGLPRTSTISLRLVEIINKDNEITKRGQNIEKFTLVFEAEGKARPKDKIYTVSHPTLGTFEIFISTVGRSGNRFQAVFNRISL